MALTWKVAAGAELATRTKQCTMSIMLDLSKAFERIPHAILYAHGVALGFCRRLIRMSLKAYRLPRRIGVNGIFSRLVLALQGVTAGDTFATTYMRLIMLSVMDRGHTLWRELLFELYVDDASIAGAGRQPKRLARRVATAVDFMVTYLQVGIKLEVSSAKSKAVGSLLAMGRHLVRKSRSGKLTAVKNSKLLGTTAAGGRQAMPRPVFPLAKVVLLVGA